MPPGPSSTPQAQESILSSTSGQPPLLAPSLSGSPCSDRELLFVRVQDVSSGHGKKPLPRLLSSRLDPLAPPQDFMKPLHFQLVMPSCLGHGNLAHTCAPLNRTVPSNFRPVQIHGPIAASVALAPRGAAFLTLKSYFPLGVHDRSGLLPGLLLCQIQVNTFKRPKSVCLPVSPTARPTSPGGSHPL